MIVTTQSADIESNIKSIWDAIVKADQVVRWSADVDQILDDAGDYPTANKTYRWRYRMAFPRLILFDTPKLIDPYTRYFSHGRMLGLNWEESYSLTQQANNVKVEINLKMTCSWVLIGGLVERFYLQKVIDKQINQSLDQLSQFCQSN
jgi:hypothetical protein